MVKLKVRWRKNMEGKRCVAPFINGQNVWDIPVKEWTPAVAMAIASAYEIGRDSLAAEMTTLLHKACYEPVTEQPWENDDGH